MHLRFGAQIASTALDVSGRQPKRWTLAWPIRAAASSSPGEPALIHPSQCPRSRWLRPPTRLVQHAGQVPAVLLAASQPFPQSTHLVATREKRRQLRRTAYRRRMAPGLHIVRTSHPEPACDALLTDVEWLPGCRSSGQHSVLHPQRHHQVVVAQRRQCTWFSLGSLSLGARGSLFAEFRSTRRTVSSSGWGTG